MRHVKRTPGMLRTIDYISRDPESDLGKAWSAYCPFRTESGEWTNNKGQYLGEVVVSDALCKPGEVVLVGGLFGGTTK